MMKRLVVLSFALAALASGAVACESIRVTAATPTPTLSPLPTPLPEILALQTICLEVEQSYPDIEEDFSSTVCSRPYCQPGWEQSYPDIEGDFSLPIGETAEGVLRGLGLQVVARGASCDATLTISLTGTPLGKDYTVISPFGKGSTHCYTGADVSGQMAVTMADHELLTLPFRQTKWPESGTIVSCPDKAEAPFASVWPKALLDGLTRLWGFQAPICALVHENNAVHGAALETLRNFGPDAVPALTRALEDDDWMGRVEAARALQWMEIHTVETVPTLIEALENEDEEVRKAAASALGDTPAVEEATRALIEALGEEAARVREAAACALGKIGPAEGVAPELIEALRDDDADVRQAAASALGNMGPQQGVVHALIEALADQDEWVRFNAASALRVIGPEEGVVPALIQALSDECSFVRIEVAGALREITGQDFGQDPARWLEWWEAQ